MNGDERVNYLERTAPREELEAVYDMKGPPLDDKGRYFARADVLGLFSECMPADLTGKTVLDLGGHEGHMAKLALHRGAASATVVDNQQFRDYPEIDRRVSGPTMFVSRDLMEWTEPADVVLFSNVLYHVKDPFGTMEHVASLAKEMVCLMCWITNYDADDWNWQLAAGTRAHPTDPTIFWIPAAGGLRRLAEVVGLTLDWVGTVGDRMAIRGVK